MMRNRCPLVRQGSLWGFTLVELMVAVAILGIVAAMGISYLSKFRYRSMAGEVPTITGGILGTYETFAARWGTYPAAAAQPLTDVDSGFRRNWTDSGGFMTAGFRANGATYHRYSVLTDGGAEAAKAPSALSYKLGTADGFLGIDNNNYICGKPGINGCTATNLVEATRSPDLSIVVVGDLDGLNGPYDCVYVASDENFDLKPRWISSSEVCGDEAF